MMGKIGVWDGWLEVHTNQLFMIKVNINLVDMSDLVMSGIIM
jgi:hypothetical protein